MGNVLIKDTVWYRVNEITNEFLDSGEIYLGVRLQAVSSPYNGLRIIVNPSSLLLDRGYVYFREFIDEIDSQKYTKIELDETSRESIGNYFNKQVNYVYFFETKSLIFFKQEALFLWPKSSDEWTLKIGQNGYASLSEVSTLENVNKKIIEKSEELRQKGNPEFWSESLSNIVYSISSSKVEIIYFSFSGNIWKASVNQKDWISVSSIVNGEYSSLGALSESDLNLIMELYLKNFSEGLDILLIRSVTGWLNTL